MNLSRLFRSRWAALWWAAGILWFAYGVASETTTAPAGGKATGAAQPAAVDALGTAVSANDLAILANAAAM